MAREFIALDQNVPFDDIVIETASIRMQDPVFRELLESSREIRNMRAHAQKLENEAMRNAQEFARWLAAYGIPVRDIAELLDISPQRVSQLANEQGVDRGPTLDADDVTDLLEKLQASVAQRSASSPAKKVSGGGRMRIKTSDAARTVRIPVKGKSTRTAAAAKTTTGGKETKKSSSQRRREHG